MAAAVLALGGCSAGNVCGEKQSDMMASDGGVFRCLRAEDCPRSSNVFVCVNDGLPDKECVSCEDTRCVQHVPEKCQ
jgi:hypothetical protein